MKIISNRIIRELKPCYDPSQVVKDENEELGVKEWVEKYRSLVKDLSDIVWLLCNECFMSDKDMRLFAVWNARKALKLIDNPSPISINTCDVAELFANGKATKEELSTARHASWDVANDTNYAARSAADYATNTAINAAANNARYAATTTADYAAIAAAKAADSAAAGYTAVSEQLDQLLTYFN